MNVPLRIPGMYNAFILSFSRFIKLLTSTIQLYYFDCVRFCVVSSLLFNSFLLFSFFFFPREKNTQHTKGDLGFHNSLVHPSSPEDHSQLHLILKCSGIFKGIESHLVEPGFMKGLQILLLGTAAPGKEFKSHRMLEVAN